MGFLSRLHNVVNAVGSAGEDFGGFFSDIATAPWNDDVNGSPLTVLYNSTVKRGGGLISDLIGPSGIGGTIAGGLPSYVRRPVADVVNPTLDALNVAYRDAISHPTAAALTAGSLSDRPGGGGLGGLFHANTWKQAWELSQHESPGQAFALAAQTKDILNPTEVAAAKRSQTYQTISGISDAILQLTNPLNAALGAEGLGAAKKTLIGEHGGTLATALAQSKTLGRHPTIAKLVVGDGGKADLERLVNSGRLEDFASRIDGKSAAEIRDTYFPKHAAGGHIADVLHTAGQTGDTVPALRVMLGHQDELDRLAGRSAELASKIDRVTAPRAEFEREFVGHADVAPDVVTNQLERLKAATKELTDQEWQNKRLDALQGSLTEFPTKVTLAAQEGRHAVEDWFQHGPYSSVTHVIHNMQPHGLINFDEAGSDIQLSRMLRQAKVPTEVEQKWVGDYLHASNSTDRAAVFEKAQEAAIDHIGQTLGLDPGEAADLVSRASFNKNRVTDILRNMQYDGEGRASLQFEGPNGELIKRHMPLWITQQAQYAPIIDMNKVREGIQPLSTYKARYGSLGDAAEHVFATFDHIWRPAVLLTPGGVIRRIGDEAIRSTIRLGMLSQLQHIEAGTKNAWRKHFGDESPGTHEMNILGDSFQGAMGAPGDAGDLYAHLASSSSSLQTLFAAGEDGVYKHLHPSGSWESIAPNDARYRGKVGGLTPWERAVNRQIGQDPIFQHFLAGETPAQVETWLTKTQEGRYLAKQISTPARHRRAMLDGAYQQMRAYLPTDELRLAAKDGKATHAMLDAAVERDVQPVVHGELLAEATGNGPVMQHVQHVTSWLFDKMESKPTDFLMRNPTFSDIYTREVTRRALLAKGQGAVLDDALKETISKQSRRYALNESKHLFDDYTDRSQIARQLRFVVPFYGAYTQQVARYAGVISSDPAWVRKLQQVWQAPAKAGIVTDAAGNVIDEKGNITEPAGLPDFGPTDAVGLIRPGNINLRARPIVKNRDGSVSTVRSITITDDQGRAVLIPTVVGGKVVSNDDAITHYKATGENLGTFSSESAADSYAQQLHESQAAYAAAVGQRVGDKAAPGSHYITLTLPKELQSHIPGMRAGGQLRLGQSGLNLLTRGLPNFGPLVQLPVNEIAKENPSLAQSLKFVLPYGAVQDTKNIILPTTLKHIAATENESGQLFTNTRVRIYHDLLVTDNLKHKYEAPTPADQKALWNKAGSQARAFMSVHTVSQFFIPTSYTLGSPYQKYIDSYRSRLTYDSKLSDSQRALPGYQSPSDWFLNTFGPEYFPLTESLSHTNNGVPPTIEAFNAQAKDPSLAALIGKNPDYGNLILGGEGAGAFNYSVYQYQFAHQVGDESGRKQRASATPEEARVAPSVSLGWSEYSKMADLITTQLAVAGIGNLNDKRAAGLRAIKQLSIAQLAEKFPDWYEDYSKTDELSNQKKIIALTKISKSEPMMSPARLDMAGLREYLGMRDQFTTLLGLQQHSTLTANDNAGLRALWETSVQALVERNPAFGALYNRWLSRDQIAALTPAAASYQSAVA